MNASAVKLQICGGKVFLPLNIVTVVLIPLLLLLNALFVQLASGSKRSESRVVNLKNQRSSSIFLRSCFSNSALKKFHEWAAVENVFIDVRAVLKSSQINSPTNLIKYSRWHKILKFQFRFPWIFFNIKGVNKWKCPTRKINWAVKCKLRLWCRRNRKKNIKISFFLRLEFIDWISGVWVSREDRSELRTCARRLCGTFILLVALLLMFTFAQLFIFLIFNIASFSGFSVFTHERKKYFRFRRRKIAKCAKIALKTHAKKRRSDLHRWCHKIVIWISHPRSSPSWRTNLFYEPI